MHEKLSVNEYIKLILLLHSSCKNWESMYGEMTNIFFFCEVLCLLCKWDYTYHGNYCGNKWWKWLCVWNIGGLWYKHKLLNLRVLLDQGRIEMT